MTALRNKNIYLLSMAFNYASCEVAEVFERQMEWRSPPVATYVELRLYDLESIPCKDTDFLRHHKIYTNYGVHPSPIEWYQSTFHRPRAAGA